MDKIEKIKEWVKKQKKEELARNSIGVITGKALFVDANELLSFLDTLSEEPDKSLEEEIETWIPAHISIRTDETLPINPTELADICKEWGKCIALHFAEWQKNQIFKDAINGWLDEDNEPPYDLNVICEEKIPFGKFKHGDKVRIIVLKDEEE